MVAHRPGVLDEVSGDIGIGLALGDQSEKFLLLSGSRSGATPYDDAHNAFMTLPPYTRTRDEVAVCLLQVQNDS
jgi:hypothetical protein